MRINKLVRESWPAFRFIGKKYSGPANWDEWWANGWFETLEALPLSALNQDGYTEAIHTAAGQPEQECTDEGAGGAAHWDVVA